MTNDYRNDRMKAVLMIIIEMYKKPMSAPLMRVWDLSLVPYTIDSIEKALVAHISDPVKSAFEPKPGDLILHITGTRRDRAAIASHKLQLAIRQATAHTGVTFDDPLINLAIWQLGGWVTCYYSVCDAEKSHDYISEFAKVYERLAKASTSQHPAYLPGRDKNGSFVPVGDAAGVRQTVLSGYDPKNPQLMRYAANQIGSNA